MIAIAGILIFFGGFCVGVVLGIAFAVWVEEASKLEDETYWQKTFFSEDRWKIEDPE